MCDSGSDVLPVGGLWGKRLMKTRMRHGPALLLESFSTIAEGTAGGRHRSERRRWGRT